METLKGKKTYIIATLLALVGANKLLTGDMAGPLLAGAGLSCVRLCRVLSDRRGCLARLI